MKTLKIIFSLCCLILFMNFSSCKIEPEPEKVVVIPDPEPEPEAIPEAQPEKLVLLIYMAADNDLESFAIQDLKEMEHANFSNIKVLVLLDRAEEYDQTNDNWTDTRLYEVAHDETNGNFIISKRIACPVLGLSEDKETELDMSNESVLSNFITYAKENYDAEKYAVIIWGHGTGWRYSDLVNCSAGRAVAVDDKTDSYMSVLKMGEALENKGLSVIGFDTCFGGVFENVYEVKNAAEYTVGCSDFTPTTGWNYTKLLENLSESDFSSSCIAKVMAESSSVKTTVYENSKMNQLFASFENFAEFLSASVTDEKSRNEVFNQLIKSKGYSYNQYPCDFYLDILAMAKLYENSENAELAKKSLELVNSVNLAGKTTDSENAEIGVHFIPKTSAQTVSPQHSSEYIKTLNNTSQCTFIKNSLWWVPTENFNSGSLLDKLFYKAW